MIKGYESYTPSPHALKRMKQRFMVYGGNEVKHWLRRTLSQAEVDRETSSSKGVTIICHCEKIVFVLNKTTQTVTTVYPDGYYKYKEQLKEYEESVSGKPKVSNELVSVVNNALDTYRHKVIQRSSAVLAKHYQVLSDVHTVLGRTRNYKKFDEKFDNTSAVIAEINKELDTRDKLLAEIKMIEL